MEKESRARARFALTSGRLFNERWPQQPSSTMSFRSHPLLSPFRGTSRPLPDNATCHPDAPPLIAPSATVPSCLDPSSAFFRVLTAPYAPILPIPSQPVDPVDAERCSAMIDWSRRPNTPESPPDSSDEEDQAIKANNAAYHENAERVIYRPHGKWAWTDGLPIEDVIVVAPPNRQF
jgi:hypothetical protein